MYYKKSTLFYHVKQLLLFLIIFIIFLQCNKKKDNLDLFGQDIKAKKLDQVTLVFYIKGKEHPDLRVILDEVEKRSRKKLNIKLDFKFFSGNSTNNLKKIVDSGQPCDGFVMTSWMNIGHLLSLYENDLILDLTELFPVYAPDYYSKFNQNDLALMKVDNKLLAIPNRYFFSYRRCAIIRDDLCRKYNIKKINTYAELEEFLDLIKQNEPDFIPLSTANNTLGLFAESFGYVIFNYQLSLVYKYNDPEMKLLAWEQTPEYQESIRIINRWINKGFYVKDIFFAKPQKNLISSGNWACFINFQGMVEQFNRWISETEKDFRYLEFPLYPNQKSMRITPSNNSLVISKNSKNPERVLMFFDWLNKDRKNYDLFHYGIKSRHYVLKGDQFTIPDDVSLAKSYSSWNGRRVFMNIEMERTHISNSNTYVQQVMDFMLEKSVYSPHTGFYAKYGEVDGIVNIRKMDFNKIEWEMGRGKYSEERIDEYIKRHKELGVDKIIAVVQSQLDEWRKNKKTD